MNLEPTSDTTSLSYWLNWRFLLCAIWVLTPMIAALWMIWKYELRCESRCNQDQPWLSDEAWRPCLRQIHPIWLLVFRLLSFISLMAPLLFKVYRSGARIYFYYTQWTFTLLTVYFGCGSLLSVYGCCQNMAQSRYDVESKPERGLRKPLMSDEAIDIARKSNTSNPRDKESVSHLPWIWTHLFEILFQMNIGAVMLTDAIYWIIIFPFITIQDYSPSFLTITMHSINIILLLGEAALNCLRVPFFRISFFILWTGVFVIFQWILHACVPIWWPYPFLDLSSRYAPLWYLLIGIMHIPSYGLFGLIVRMKGYLLAKWFPLSFQL